MYNWDKLNQNNVNRRILPEISGLFYTLQAVESIL